MYLDGNVTHITCEIDSYSSKLLPKYLHYEVDALRVSVALSHFLSASSIYINIGLSYPIV